MKTYTITSTVTLYSGILWLTPEQAAPRLPSLNDLGDGLYQIVSPVQFKSGETIGYDGDVNRELMQLLTSDAPESDEAPEPIRRGKKR